MPRVLRLVGAGEQPRLSAKCHPAQGALCGIVRQANAPVTQEGRECRPVLEQIVARGRDRVVARHGGALAAQPFAQLGHQRQAEFLTRGLALGRGLPSMARSMSNSASIRLTASAAMGEMTGAPHRRRACPATSASSKNFRRACAQHSARTIGAGARSPRNSALYPA
jgi:hypothetical protein